MRDSVLGGMMGGVTAAILCRCACPERVSGLLGVRASERRGASVA